MYLIGEKISENNFRILYAVYDNKKKAIEFLNKTKDRKKLSMELYDNLEYPFFLIEEIEKSNNQSNYSVISKKELEKKIASIDTVSSDDNHIYFNLWRIDKNSFNYSYPGEPILTGRDFHIHFTNFDWKEIQNNGLESYWEEINKL